LTRRWKYDPHNHTGGFSERYGTVFAEPAVAEKGYMDTRVEVCVAGQRFSFGDVFKGQESGWSFQRSSRAYSMWLRKFYTARNLTSHYQTIGILSALLVEYEKNPITPVLKRDTVPYATLQCLGAHAADMPCKLRHLIQKSRNSKRALRKLESLIFQDRSMKAKVGTTQAIDLIKGGVKTNALPESADAVINHRIATDR
jgi:Gly-Xaa carboxypeptidase